jgi:hypothetical protein
MFGDGVMAARERVTERNLGFQTFAVDSRVGNVDPPGGECDRVFDRRDV